MFAFVAAAAPVASFASSLASTSALRAPARAAAAATTMMAAKSPSLPFMNAPKSIPADTPGYAGFDPLGFCEAFDLKWMQEAEIKNGRVAMLAALGLVFPEIFSFSFYTPPAGALPASKEMHDYFVQTGAMKQILLWTSFAEIFGMFALKETLEGDRIPGYFGLDPLGLAGAPGTDKFAKFQAHEIKNGRLAMIAAGGLIHGQWVTGETTLANLAHFHGVPVRF